MRWLAAGFLLVLPAAVALSATPLDLAGISGLYERSFPNRLSDGTRFTSTNTLRIIRLSPSQAHVEAELEFSNVHQCTFSEVMTVQGDVLAYKGPNILGDICEMRVWLSRGMVVLEDVGQQCQVGRCGARGSLDGESFSASSRRAVPDVRRLREQIRSKLETQR